MKLQQLLDDYGASCKCNDWEGWVRECMQNPDMVVSTFNGIVEEFRKQRRYRNIRQIAQALEELKKICYDKNNLCRNQAHYMTLLGDNKPTNEWFVGVSQ